MVLIRSGGRDEPIWDAMQMLLKVKELLIKINILCVLQVAMSTMDNPLLKYNAKEYFFKASLCHFIVDELNAKVTLMLVF